FLFFFSSRRRHTRSKRDWSSDVCSSDLRAKGAIAISDDEIRESLENAQLKLQRERGTDVTIFSPRASAMAHHIGDETTSLHWSQDRKSTRLNSSHVSISYAVFCLKKKK